MMGVANRRNEETHNQMKYELDKNKKQEYNKRYYQKRSLLKNPFSKNVCIDY